VDWPAAHYWRDLVTEYPQARVILTWRDPESWWKSYEATILRYVRTTTDPEAVGVRVVGVRRPGRRPRLPARAIRRERGGGAGDGARGSPAGAPAGRWLGATLRLPFGNPTADMQKRHAAPQDAP
jgi:hypothetical protein